MNKRIKADIHAPNIPMALNVFCHPFCHIESILRLLKAAPQWNPEFNTALATALFPLAYGKYSPSRLSVAGFSLLYSTPYRILIMTKIVKVGIAP